jgi:F1F0 ATPase subunit 2
MTEAWGAALPGVALGLAAGVGLGALAFGGLWWTVRRLTRQRRPHLVLVLSSVVRLGLVAVALAGLARLGLGPLAGGVVGLIGVRLVLTRRLGRPAPPAPARPAPAAPGSGG